MDNIRIAVRDSTDSYNVAFFDNEAGIKFKTPNLTKFLAGSASMLSLSFNSKDIDTVKTGCKLSFVYKNKPYWLNVMDVQKNGFKMNLIAYSLVLEINNEQKGSYKSDKAQSIAQYVRIFDPENSLTIGINEVADKSIKLEWTGTDTLLDRLYSIANSFDAEFGFVTETNSDYSLRRHVLNIYRKGNLGKDLTGQPVRVGKDLKVINYSDNIKELYSAVYATGKDGLTIAGLTKTVNDDAGKPLYVTDGAYLRAPQTRDRFPSVGRNSTDNYLLLDLGSTEYETKEALYGYMLAELQKASVPKVSYTAEGSMDGEIGDKMTLIDDLHFDPPLYVQARISEMTEDIITGRVTETTFTNYERKYSQLSDTLLKRVEELAKEAMPYTLELATNNGTGFKNGSGNSQITPNLKRGSETISGASFVWTINGTSTTASTYTVTAAAVSGTAVVKVEAVLAGKVVASSEITFTNVADGRDGRDGVAGRDGVGLRATSVTYGLSSTETIQPTSWTASVPTLVKGQYLWTKTVWTYTDNSTETGYQKTYISKDGNNGSDGIAGKDGVGISSTSITYARSTSGTTAPTSGWTSSVPTAPAGEFLWTKTVWSYTDNTSETGYSVARMGANGPQGPQGLQGIQGPKGADGIAGKDGKGITNTVITYGISASETTQPTNWTASVPTLVKGQYLWTKTVWTYTDNTNETGYTKTYIAKDGNNGTDGIAGKDGVGITSTSITYARSTSGTSAPSSGWTSAVPSVPAGEFLWTKTIWNYSDSTSETGYSVARMGANGPQGPQGPQGLQGPKGDQGISGVKGADGKTQYTHIAYADTSSGGGFSQTDQTKAYIGMYQDFTATDSTNPASYKWTKWKGSDGDQGIPGPKGADGQTPYVHFAYSDKADGTDLTTSDNGQRYIGHYSDYTQADSTVKTKYRWADRWAKIEVGGKNVIRNSAFGNAIDSSERFTVGGVTYVNKTIPNWNYLYNGGIPNPTTSYHAIYKESFERKGPVIEFNESNGSRNGKVIAANLQASELNLGNYTFSADIYATGAGTKIWFGFYYYNKSGVRNFHSGQTTINISTINKWHRVAGQIKLNDDIDLSKEVFFFIYAFNFTSNSILYLTKPQLEEGTVATPYGESQSDINNRINSKADQAELAKVVYKTDISVTNEGIIHSASKTVNGQTIASMIAQRAEWVEIIAQLLKVKGDMIVDGAITGVKLDVSDLSAISADLGSVNAGKMLLQRSFSSGSSAVPAYNYPAFKTGLFVDNYGLIVNGNPVQKFTTEATASDMPVVAVTSGEIRFLRANLTDNIEEVLHTGLSDPDFGYIQFGRDLDGRNALIIEANGQVYLKGENYTDWAFSTIDNRVRWKVQGNLVIVDYDVTFPTGGTKRIVTVPTKYVPKALMLTAKAWHTFLDRDRNAQLNADGGLHILGAEANQRYCGQIIWSY